MYVLYVRFDMCKINDSQSVNRVYCPTFANFRNQVYLAVFSNVKVLPVTDFDESTSKKTPLRARMCIFVGSISEI